MLEKVTPWLLWNLDGVDEVGRHHEHELGVIIGLGSDEAVPASHCDGVAKALLKPAPVHGVLWDQAQVNQEAGPHTAAPVETRAVPKHGNTYTLAAQK